MKDATRRGFLAISGAGVAAAAVAPSAMAAGRPAADSKQEQAAASGAMLAYVHDASKGEVTLMKGENEIVVRDAALVRALAKHAAKMGK
ncbi:hypothetical protein V3N99_09150 [Dermatophilaceae bacterium Soc4.6]